MKIVYVETDEQIERIQRLVKYVYTEIFPRFFTDHEIDEFRLLNFLNVDGKIQRNGTLPESYQIIACLETIIFIIESGVLDQVKYQRLFIHNVKQLTKIGYDFPFSYQSFLKTLPERPSMYRRAQNEWLI